MHPALHSWREELPSSFVRVLAYLGAVTLLSIAAARVSQSPVEMSVITPVHQPEWIEVERPFPAFALSIPEAADTPSSYAIRRHIKGGGRKDILTLGEPDFVAPFLQVEIYRPGNEIDSFAPPLDEIAASAAALGPGMPDATMGCWTPIRSACRCRLPDLKRYAAAMPRLRAYLQRPALADIGLVLPGRWRGDRARHARLRARPAGAAGRRQRAKGRCAVRESRAQPQLLRPARPDLAATPKYHLLWKALANRPEPRRIGR